MVDRRLVVVVRRLAVDRTGAVAADQGRPPRARGRKGRENVGIAGQRQIEPALAFFLFQLLRRLIGYTPIGDSRGADRDIHRQGRERGVQHIRGGLDLDRRHARHVRQVRRTGNQGDLGSHIFRGARQRMALLTG